VQSARNCGSGAPKSAARERRVVYGDGGRAIFEAGTIVAIRAAAGAAHERVQCTLLLDRSERGRTSMAKGFIASRTLAVGTGVAALVCLGVLGHRAANATKTEATYFAPSTSQTVWRGFYPKDAPPLLTVPSGAIVQIDTLSHQGLNQLPSGQPDPVTQATASGIPADQVLADATDVYYNLDYANRSKPSGGTHVLTGPIYIDGAEPGDTLEVRILKVQARVPWGRAPGGKIVYIDGNKALFAPGIEISLKPFQGIMATAPSDDYVSPIPEVAAAGFAGTRPPGPYGGNMDTNDLGEGTSLYLPVFRPGAQFFTGDPHQVQGNGEIGGSALEQSNTVTFQFILHKGGGLTGPRAETPTHYILMGIHVDLDVAERAALRDALDFLQAEKGFTPAEAMSFASLAVDLNIAEAVDFTQLVMARIPKRFFKDDYGKQPVFWHKPLTVKSEAQRQGLEDIR
jgi:acetamidase/formamidase